MSSYKYIFELQLPAFCEQPTTKWIHDTGDTEDSMRNSVLIPSSKPLNWKIYQEWGLEA